ncbi:hypothetical protein SASPL_146947 [Salvia splendens]|uniref:Uncharacterized protein n=1 Tax=Salvia splendens TaxID=180675 RepID=A0A8X8WD47_SALSN|nr:hypothetical protein SASPL_146947 [Salvia splendens]
MALLGEDGRGYELARKLESQGIWRSWLGDALYSSFIPFLSSPAAWDSFMLPDDSKSRPQISLELRARALLFDKASVSLFAQPTALSKLNPNCHNCFYLELHGDDVYFTLENGAQDVDQRHPGVAASSTTSSKGRSKASGIGSRFSEPDVDAVSQRLSLEELPETWYNQFFEKYRATKSYTLMFGDRDSEKRTPEQMSTYLSLIENHKRRRVAFVDNISSLRSNPVMVDGSPADDAPLFPETMSIFNCVPDSAVLKTRRLENNQKVPFNGVLDNLPQTMTKSPVMSPIMIERLGIRPEYLSMEQGQGWGKNGSQGSRKLLTTELLKMFLQTAGYSSSSSLPFSSLSSVMFGHVTILFSNFWLSSSNRPCQCQGLHLRILFFITHGHSQFIRVYILKKEISLAAENGCVFVSIIDYLHLF